MSWLKWIVTGFGAGLLPKAPGTMGTLVAIPIWYLVCLSGPYGYMAITLILTVGSIFLCEMYEKQCADHDPGHVVIDEIVGFLIAMTWLPVSIFSVVCAFLVFRLFDIWKPWPISYLNDKVRGGFGVVIDDVAAGLVTNILLQLLVSYLYA